MRKLPQSGEKSGDPPRVAKVSGCDGSNVMRNSAWDAAALVGKARSTELVTLRDSEVIEDHSCQADDLSMDPLAIALMQNCGWTKSCTT